MFAQEIGIPHGTLVSALNNGIDGMAWHGGEWMLYAVNCKLTW